MGKAILQHTTIQNPIPAAVGFKSNKGKVTVAFF